MTGVRPEMGLLMKRQMSYLDWVWFTSEKDIDRRHTLNEGLTGVGSERGLTVRKILTGITEWVYQRERN